jgi:hypothetical protein
MSERPASTPVESQRNQPALWPWGVALSFALAGSGWWAWDLFKSPNEESGHPRLPSMGAVVQERDLLSSAPTASGHAASAARAALAASSASEARLP